MKIAVFSHCTIDSIELRNSIHELPGGPACYCSITAKNLKFDSELYTKYGKDFPKEILLNKNINFENALSDLLTTRFKIRINDSDRTLSLLNTCEPIEYSPIDVDGVVVSPVYHEITSDVYEKILNGSNFIFLDPQGFLRRTDSEKKIILENTDIDLSKISAIKTSPDDIYSKMEEKPIGSQGEANKKD